MQHSNDKSETNHKEGNTPNIVFFVNLAMSALILSSEYSVRYKLSWIKSIRL